MKKIVKTLSMLLFVVCIAFTATACINSNPTKVEDKLMDKDYEVMSFTQEEEIAEFLEEMYINSERTIINPKKVNCILCAVKGSRSILIAFCEDKDTAKKLEEEVEELVIDFAELLGIDEENCETGRSSKVVYIGHKDAVKDVK